MKGVNHYVEPLPQQWCGNYNIWNSRPCNHPIENPWPYNHCNYNIGGEARRSLGEAVAQIIYP